MKKSIQKLHPGLDEILQCFLCYNTTPDQLESTALTFIVLSS